MGNNARQKFGAHVRALRIAKGLTQSELAAKIKISTTYLCGIERGVGSLKAAKLMRLAKALDALTPELFELAIVARAPDLHEALDGLRKAGAA